MKTQKLVFYSKRDMVPPDATVLTARDMKKILHRFERGEIQTLYVPVNLLCGWRTKLTSSQVQLEFLGGFNEHQQLQAAGRLSFTAKERSMIKEGEESSLQVIEGNLRYAKSTQVERVIENDQQAAG